MEASFWHQKWENNAIGFHQHIPNPLLVKYFNTLSLDKGDRLFLPLCGKTLDIAWLLERGYRVAGVELSELAIEQLFSSLDVEPKITEIGTLKHYGINNLDIFAGDIFQVSRKILGDVDAVYDRAALVALPETMRLRYAAHLMKISGHAQQLLVTFEYDQNAMNGPPFSVIDDEVHTHYQNSYNVSLLEQAEVKGGLKGICPATEHVWLLE